MSLMSLVATHRGEMMKTFSEMAEEWLRGYMRPQEVQQGQEELAGDGANAPWMS